MAYLQLFALIDLSRSNLTRQFSPKIGRVQIAIVIERREWRNTKRMSPAELSRLRGHRHGVALVVKRVVCLVYLTIMHFESIKHTAYSESHIQTTSSCFVRLSPVQGDPQFEFVYYNDMI